MDFIPAGYLSIRDAVDRILRTTHGDDWGEQEVKFETDAIDGSMVLDDDSLSKGQPLDRQAVAKVRQQVSDAEVSLFSAFLTGDLGANIENGPPVPKSYWKSPSARTTVSTGILALGGGAKPEDLKWQNHRVILIGDKFDAWLAGPLVLPPCQLRLYRRRHEIGRRRHRHRGRGHLFADQGSQSQQRHDALGKLPSDCRRHHRAVRFRDHWQRLRRRRLPQSKSETRAPWSNKPARVAAAPKTLNPGQGGLRGRAILSDPRRNTKGVEDDKRGDRFFGRHDRRGGPVYGAPDLGRAANAKTRLGGGLLRAWPASTVSKNNAWRRSAGPF